MTRLLPLLALLPTLAWASPYKVATQLIDQLYLEQESISAEKLLAHAARGLEDEVHWLFVREEGNTVHLRHGDGTELGSASVSSMSDLPQALAELESLLLASPYDIGSFSLHESILSGMTKGLDRPSRVLSGNSYRSFDTRIKGTLVGIGATFSLRSHRMVITSVTEGGPAEQGGLQRDDEITRIDGRSTVSMPTSEVSRRLRGTKGTEVVLELLREEKPVTLTLTRDQVIVPNVIAEVLPGVDLQPGKPAEPDVAYVRITHMSQKTTQNLTEALAELAESGALEAGLVIDLRGNTGGSMKESAGAVDQFVKSGLLLRTVGHDGGSVRNLQAEMRASDSGDEPDVPIVVLIDDRSASGSEILAGGLLELDRAALIGGRSYGKGSVQKVYSLDSDMKLKLSVARYLLANGRTIHHTGIVPDVVLGQIELGHQGVRYKDFNEGFQRTPFDEILPEVDEWSGWRGEYHNIDLAKEMARKALIAAKGSKRSAILASVERVAKEMRVEQEELLAAALGAKEIDWSPAESEGEEIEALATVRVTLEEQEALVEIEVSNLGDTPLHRTLVQLECASLAAWDGIVVPVGRVDPGGTGAGSLRITLPRGMESREDAVAVKVRADKRPPLLLDDQLVTGHFPAKPELSITAKLVPGEGAAMSGGTMHTALVEVHNLSDQELEGVEVHLGYPEEEWVELHDQGMRANLLLPESHMQFSMAVELLADPGEAFALPIEVKASAVGKLIDWKLTLPTDGGEVALRAPRIDGTQGPLHAPVGRHSVPIKLTDERSIDHAMVWFEGNKIAWWGGGEGERSLSPEVTLQEGTNRVYVTVVDDQGVRVERRITIRGESGAAADATP